MLPDGTLMRWDGVDWQLANFAPNALPDGAPRGLLATGYTVRTTDLLSQAAPAFLVQSAIGYQIRADRAYEISCSALLGVSTAPAAPQLTLRVEADPGPVTTSSLQLDFDRQGQLINTGISGAVRYKIHHELMPGVLDEDVYWLGLTAQIIAGTGSGNWNGYADPTYPTFISIQDLGIPGAIAVP